MFLKDGVKTGIPDDFVKEFKKTVVFELCQSQGGFNAGTGKHQFPVIRGILPFYNVDELKKDEKGNAVTKAVEWRYAQSATNLKNGAVDYNPATLDFAAGRIVCDPASPNAKEIYFLLANHPANQGNPKRDATKSPIFFMVDPIRTAREEMEIRKARHKAEEIILGSTDEKFLRKIALHYEDIQANDRNLDQLQKYLLPMVEKNPKKFIEDVELLQNEESMRGMITEAIALGIVELKGLDWYWKNTSEEKAGNLICKVANRGDDAVSRLIRFLERAQDDNGMEYFIEQFKAAKQPVESSQVL